MKLLSKYFWSYSKIFQFFDVKIQKETFFCNFQPLWIFLIIFFQLLELKHYRKLKYFGEQKNTKNEIFLVVFISNAVHSFFGGTNFQKNSIFFLFSNTVDDGLETLKDVWFCAAASVVSSPTIFRFFQVEVATLVFLQDPDFKQHSRSRLNGCTKESRILREIVVLFLLYTRKK